MRSSHAVFYLFAAPSGVDEVLPSTVFYKVEDEGVADVLVALFAKEYSNDKGFPSFQKRPASLLSVEEHVLLDEALADLEVYQDPDIGIYDPPPSAAMFIRAQYLVRAQRWEGIIRQRVGSHGSQSSDSEQTGGAPGGPREMSEDESRNAAQLLLLQFAQAYYKLLESTVASKVYALDMELNESYFWVVKNVTNLLENHEGVKDFPVQFEPLFQNLYPSTIRDCDWEDFAAPHAEEFLSAAQQYAYAKGAIQPEENSPGWIFLELFRTGVEAAIARAGNYQKRMHEHFKKMLAPTKQPAKATDSLNASNLVTRANLTPDKNLVFVSYSHRDKKFLDELLRHLRPFERAGRIAQWSDQQIVAGSVWFETIKESLTRTRVAVMLVSPSFLASDFIHEHELGPLLKQAESGGARILWVPIRACSYKETPLRNYQAASSPDKPLAEMKANRDKAWVHICAEVATALKEESDRASQA